MMKKIVLCMVVLGCRNVAAESNYAFMMHVTHAADYEQKIWQKSTFLLDRLVKQCNETENDKSAEAFQKSQKQAIETAHKVFYLCKHKPGFQVNTQVLRESCTMPSDGLTICFEFKCEETTSLENKNKIDAFMNELETSCTSGNDNDLLNNLKNLEHIFELLSGKSWLRVSILE